jgi:hypothetical protein
MTKPLPPVLAMDGDPEVERAQGPMAEMRQGAHDARRARKARRIGLIVLGLSLLLIVGVRYAVARVNPPVLGTRGPTQVVGAATSGVVRIDGREIRRVRYRDQATLDYAFRLTNAQGLPLTVTGVDSRQRDTPLFGYVGLEGSKGSHQIELPAYGSEQVHLLLRMRGCQRVAPRDRSAAVSVLLRTERFGVSAGSVLVQLPEEIHTGSPRRKACPRPVS